MESIISYTETQPAQYIIPSKRERIFALLLDSLILEPILILILIFWGIFNSKLNTSFFVDFYSNYAFLLPLSGILLIVLPYFIYFTYKFGATLGKQAFGLKVLNYNSKLSPSFTQVTVREIIKSIDKLTEINLIKAIALANFPVTFFSKDQRGIHDYIAQTQVVKVDNGWPTKKKVIVVILSLIFIGFFFAINISIANLL